MSQRIGNSASTMDNIITRDDGELQRAARQARPSSQGSSTYTGSPARAMAARGTAQGGNDGRSLRITAATRRSRSPEREAGTQLRLRPLPRSPPRRHHSPFGPEYVLPPVQLKPGFGDRSTLPSMSTALMRTASNSPPPQQLPPTGTEYPPGQLGYESRPLGYDSRPTSLQRPPLRQEPYCVPSYTRPPPVLSDSYHQSPYNQQQATGSGSYFPRPERKLPEP